MNILLYITSFDKQYINCLRGMYDGHKVSPKIGHHSLQAVAVEAIRHKCKHVITSDPALLKDLALREGWDGSGERPSLDSFQGSIFHYQGLEILITNPLKQIYSVNQGKFIYKRFISKITAPSKWFETTQFTWEEAKEETIEALYERFKSAIYIAIDIETIRELNKIDCVSYCGVWWNEAEKKFETHTIAFFVTDMFWVAWMRKFNSLPAEKIFQNGKYDNTYFYLYNALPTNWLWDTINLFHSYYSELPKSLAFQSAFFVRDFFNWKFESDLGKGAKLQYNAKDSWVTAMAFLGAISEMPEWAKNNYLMEFPVVPPAFYCELQGIKVNIDKLREVKKREEDKAEILLKSLRVMTGTPEFNPRSPKQVLKLMHILGHRDCEDTNEKTLEQLTFKAPLTGRLVEAILEYRGAMKLISTYLREDKLYKGRMFFALNPHATDSGRLASTEHHLSYICYEKKKSGEIRNIGVQIQNIPREGDTVKSCLEADEGFLWSENDYEQAEARDTAYLSGDTNLIKAVDGYKDFHAVNASAFFGIPYEDIVETLILEKDAITGEVIKAKHKTLNKVIRDLAKRVNHGSNYNMGPAMLVITMGLKNIYRAGKLLKLPSVWNALQIASHLLSAYERAYPTVKTTWYKKVLSDVALTQMLVGPTGWTRYCFGRPDKNKLDLNSYVAHQPQSLNAMTLNKSFKKIFYTVLIRENNYENIRVKAQIHDSILFQYRIGHEHLVHKVKEAMEFPVKVTDSFGITRDLLVPASAKYGKKFWGEL